MSFGRCCAVILLVELKGHLRGLGRNSLAHAKALQDMLSLPPWAGVPLPQKHNGSGLLQRDPSEGGEHQVVRAGDGQSSFGGGLLGSCFVKSAIFFL